MTSCFDLWLDDTISVCVSLSLSLSLSQDALPLFGSQEEGEFRSAQRHLPGVGEVCGQRPIGEERHLFLTTISHMSWLQKLDFFFLQLRAFFSESQGVGGQRGQAGRCVTETPLCASSVFGLLHNEPAPGSGSSFIERRHVTSPGVFFVSCRL